MTVGTSTDDSTVRVIALWAAIAWGQAATTAEQRDDCKRRKRAIAEIMLVKEQRCEDDEKQTFSENPGRGNAEA